MSIGNTLARSGILMALAFAAAHALPASARTLPAIDALATASALIVISALASLIPALGLVRLAPADVLRQD